MSGRIRTVKPEWLEDEHMAAASDEARLLSVGLILLADDHGNGRAHEMFVGSRVWPYGDPHETLAKVSRAIRELSEMGFIKLYNVNNQAYFHIHNWKRHQRVDKPGRPRVPGPGEATSEPPPPGSGAGSGGSREDVASVSRLTSTPTPTPTAIRGRARGVDPERLNESYVSGLRERFGDGPAYPRASLWDPMWERLAKTLPDDQTASRLLAAFWSDVDCEKLGYKPGLLESEAPRLLAQGPKRPKGESDDDAEERALEIRDRMAREGVS